jgi:ketosteroid isomerase-like protein
MSTDIGSLSSGVAVHALNLLAARDFDGLRALLAPDVKLDWPFHQSGSPVRIEGADALIDAVRIIKVFQDLEIRLLEVNEQRDSGTSIIEARSRGTYADGRPDYTNHYIFILKVVNGKVALWREFYNKTVS